MSKNEKYYVNIDGNRIEVTHEIYHAYYSDERRERAQIEKKLRNDVMSYDALDTQRMVGLELMADETTPSMEDIAMANELRARLHRAINLLPKYERELIHAIYFDREAKKIYAERTGITVRGLNKRLNKILKKLKLMIGKINLILL